MDFINEGKTGKVKLQDIFDNIYEDCDSALADYFYKGLKSKMDSEDNIDLADTEVQLYIRDFLESHEDDYQYDLLKQALEPYYDHEYDLADEDIQESYEVLEEDVEEDHTFEEIINRMEFAEIYEDLYNAAMCIVNPKLQTRVTKAIQQCEEDGDDVEEAYSIVTSDILDMYRNDKNVEFLGEENTKIKTEDKKDIVTTLKNLEVYTFEDLEEEIDKLLDEEIIDDDQYDDFIDILSTNRDNCENYIRRRSEVTNTDWKDERFLEERYIKGTIEDMIKSLNLNESKKLESEEPNTHSLLSKVFANYPDISDEDEDYLNGLNYEELVNELKTRGWDDLLEESKLPDEKYIIKVKDNQDGYNYQGCGGRSLVRLSDKKVLDTFNTIEDAIEEIYGPYGYSHPNTIDIMKLKSNGEIEEVDFERPKKSRKIKKESEENPQEFDYRLLSRLKSDCDYYLGNGNRNAEHCLWAKNEQGQIDKMREIYNKLEEKPEWLSEEDINNYAKEMGVVDLPSITDGAAEKEIEESKDDPIKDDVKNDLGIEEASDEAWLLDSLYENKLLEAPSIEGMKSIIDNAEHVFQLNGAIYALGYTDIDLSNKLRLQLRDMLDNNIPFEDIKVQLSQQLIPATESKKIKEETNSLAFKSNRQIENEEKEIKDKFSGIEFEKNIPHKMRWKEYSKVNENDLYWITQQFFTEDDVKKFAEAFKETNFDKAYVTVRDLSTYQFDVDSKRNVLVIINKDGTYDINGYINACKEDGYDTSLYESKKLKKENKIIWTSEYQGDEETAEQAYQEYLDEFESLPETPKDFEDWLEDTRDIWFDAEAERYKEEHPEKDPDKLSTFELDEIDEELRNKVEKEIEANMDDLKEQYKEYCEEVQKEMTSPVDKERWLTGWYEQDAQAQFDVVDQDFSDNIWPMIETQCNEDILILLGSVGRWNGTFDGGKIIYADEQNLRNTMSDYDEISVEADDENKLSINYMHHDGTDTMYLYTIPKDLTELAKAMEYEDPDELDTDIRQDYVDMEELAKHVNLLVPIINKGRSNV